MLFCVASKDMTLSSCSLSPLLNLPMERNFMYILRSSEQHCFLDLKSEIIRKVQMGFSTLISKKMT